MREFNEFEQKVIRAIVRNSKRGPFLFQNIILEMCLGGKSLAINPDLKYGVLKVDRSLFKEDEPNSLVDEVREFNYTIITVINVIKTLEKNGYLVSYFETEHNVTSSFEYGNFIKGNEFITAELHDKEVIKYLIAFYNKSIFSGKYLADFVARNFKTKGEKTRNIELKVAVIALISTTLIGLIDLGIGFTELCHSSHQIHLLEKIYCVLKCCCCCY